MTEFGDSTVAAIGGSTGVDQHYGQLGEKYGRIREVSSHSG